MKPDKYVIRKTLNVAKECENCGETVTLDQYFIECNYYLLSDKLYPVDVCIVFFARCKCGEANAMMFSTGKSLEDTMKTMLNLGKEQGYQKDDYVIPPAGINKQ
jgi:hypothetical protein